MAKNKKQNRKKPTSTNNNVEVSKYIKYGAIFFMVIFGLYIRKIYRK